MIKMISVLIKNKGENVGAELLFIDYEKAEVDRNASFLYNGVVNVIEQGAPVPLVFGEHIVGSVVISAAIVSEQLGTPDNQLPEDTINFWNPTLDSWTPVGSTVAKQNGQLLITKTNAPGTIGAAETPVDVVPDTWFTVIVVYLAEFIERVNFPGSNNSTDGIDYFEGIEVAVLDDADISGEVITDPTVFAWLATEPEAAREFTTQVQFKSKDIQGDVKLRIGPLRNSSTGTIATIKSLRLLEGKQYPTPAF